MHSSLRLITRLFAVLFLSLGLLVPVGAQAAPAPVTPPTVQAAENTSGTIRGVVRDHTLEPIAEAWVDLYRDEEFVDDFFTEADGTYAFGGLQPGTYHLNAYGEETEDEWFDGAASFDDATPIVITDVASDHEADFVVSPADDEREYGEATITGKVTNASGAVLRGAIVMIEWLDDESYFELETETDAQGRYEFTDLPGGEYRVYFEHATHLGEYFHDAVDIDDADPVSLAGTQSRTVNASLHPAGTVSGKVTDSRGGALEGAEVTVYERYDGEDDWFESDWTETAENGSYRVDGLVPGTYRIGVWHPDGAFEFHQDKVRLQDAAGVAVRAGRTSTVNVKLAAPGTISGRTVNPGDGFGGGIEEGEVLVSAVDRDGNTVAQDLVPLGDPYELTGLATGRYLVCAEAMDIDVLDTCWSDAVDRDAVPIAVAAGKHVTARNLVLSPGSRLTVPLPDGLDEVLVDFYRLSGGRWVHGGQSVIDASEPSVLVPAGSYRVRLSSTNGEFVGSWHGPSTSFHDAATIRLAAARDHEPLRFSIGSSDVSLSGRITVNGRPAEEAYVEVSRIDSWGPVPRWDLVRGEFVEGSDYRIGNLEPGTYRVCATAFANDLVARQCATTTQQVDGAAVLDIAAAGMSMATDLTVVKRPSIKGWAVAGTTVTADPGTWRPTQKKFAYQWHVDGEPLEGATSSTLRVTWDVVGKQLGVEVSPVVGRVTLWSAMSDVSDWVVPGRPAKPVGIRAEDRSSTSMAGFWNEADGAEGYRIEYREGTKGKVKKLTTDTASVWLAGLKPGTEHQARVEAVNAQGGSGFTGWTSLGKTVAAPTAPSLPKTADATLDSLTIDWPDAARATTYSLLWRKGTKGAFTTIENLTESRATIDGLEVATSYQVHVVAHDANGARATSKTVTYSTLVPAAPVDLGVELGTTTAHVAWSASEGAAKYRLSRKVGSKGKVTHTTFPGDVTSTRLTGLAAGKDHLFQIAAVAPNGVVGKASAWTSFGKTAAAPATPVLAKTATAALGALTVDWNDAARAEQYTVSWRAGTKGSFTSATTTSSTFTVEGLKAATKYEFHVVALAPDGTKSATSKKVAYSTLVPAAPEGVEVMPDTTTVKVAWGDAEGAAKYKVSWKLGAKGKVSSATVTGTEHTIAKLKARSGYQVQVASVAANGVVGKATAWTAVTTKAVPAKVTGLTIAQEGPTSLAVSWTPVEAAAGGYVVSWKLGAKGKVSTVRTVSAGEASTVVSGLKANGEYFVAVRSLSADGATASDGAWVRVKLTAVQPAVAPAP